LRSASALQLSGVFKPGDQSFRDLAVDDGE
jgi:hypothetical protein